ncbi:ABC transporter permease [Microbacterium hatanonis]|uniref:ABC transporter permease n=1 Tax=Microbacterium hatanonis TaxID=404366 RepID=A0A5C8HVC1_9MICO|nr:ABC transporter permease [Microbacterium hatanonis]TXK09897.1 ABC transporter permease [Microbacterium hatanonis]
MSLATATRSELTKQFTTSIWWILALVLAVYVAFVAAGFGWALAAVATGSLPGSTGPALPVDTLPPVIYSVATSFGYVFPLLIGTLMVTSEFRHKTLTPSFLATPRRGTVLAGKVVVALAIGALYGVIGTIAAVGPGALVLAASDVPTLLGESDTWAMLARMVLSFALWALVGLGVGTIVRNQVVAIVLVLAFTQFIEPIARVAGAFVEGIEPIARLLPGAAGDALVGSSALSVAAASATEPLEWWVGGLVLLGYAVVFLVIGQFTTWRRDVD